MICRTFYRLKKTVGTADHLLNMFFLCPRQDCCAKFEDIDRKVWWEHRDDVCQRCFLGRRFRADTKHLTPSKRCECLLL